MSNKKKSEDALRFGVAFLLFALIVGCGGGGGSEGSGNSTGGPGSGPGAPPADPYDPQNVQWRRVYVEDFDFTILYPEEWSVLFDGGADPNAVIRFGDHIQKIEYYEVIIVPRGMRVRNPAYMSVQELDRRAIQIGDLSGEEILLDAEIGGNFEPIGILETNLDVGDYSISITYVGKKSIFERNLRIVRHAVGEFAIGTRAFEIERLYDPGEPAVASDGQQFLAVACRDEERSAFFGGAIVGVLIKPGPDRSGAEFTIDDERIPCRELSASVSWNGSTYLVTYIRELEFPIVANGTSFMTSQLAVVGKRVSQEGTVLDSDPILISTEGTYQETSRTKNKPAYDASNTFNGLRHFVVWEQTMDLDVYGVDNFRQIHGAFVDPNGVVSENFSIFDGMIGLYQTQNYGYWRPDAAVGDDRIMIVVGPRAEPSTMGEPSPIYAQFVDFSGNRLLPEPVSIRSDLASKRPRYPNVEFDGENFVVAWIQGAQSTSSTNDGLYGIFAKLVSPEGRLLGSDADSDGFEVLPEEERDREFLVLRSVGKRMLAFYGEIGYGIEPGVWGISFESDFSTKGNTRPVWGDRTSHLPNHGPQPDSISVAIGELYGVAVWPSGHVVRSWFFPTDFDE